MIFSGKKKSPEQVHLEMSKDFTVNVTVQQIKPLLSRMSTEQQKGGVKKHTLVMKGLIVECD